MASLTSISRNGIRVGCNRWLDFSMKRMAVDTEDDSRGNVHLINFYDGVRHYTFRRPKDALDWLSGIQTPDMDGSGEFLEPLPGNIEIWATNLGYDLNNLFQGYFHSLQITYVETRVISATLHGTKVYFRDTLNHWKMSVEKMGERIGVKKLEGDLFSKGVSARHFQIHFDKYLRRCRRDTEITYEFVEAMRKEYAVIGCELKTTVGSTALDYFNKNFWPKPTKDEVLETREINFIRKGLYGGRVEIFFTKPLEGQIYYADINSLYPACMRDHRYPVLSSRRWVTSKTINLDNEGIADVELSCPKNETIPYLPIRSDRGLIFPTGVLRSHYSYFEIREAIALGYRLEKIQSAIEFDKFCYPFREFVETLWKRRQLAEFQKDQLMSDTCKLIPNNLFGKYAQGNVHQKLVPFAGKSKLKHGDVVYGQQVLRKIETPYQPHANAIWACLTTAYGRSRLYHRGLKTVEAGRGLLLYCDTDSVIYAASHEVIKTSKELGEFKREGLFSYAHFKQPKVYHLIPRKGPHVYKAKGVPKAAQKRYFKREYAQFRRPKKLRECLRKSGGVEVQNPNAQGSSFRFTFKYGRVVRPREFTPNYWDLTKKELTQKYNKRKILKSGHTRPLNIEQSRSI